MAGWTTEVLRFVHDQEVDAGGNRVIRDLWPGCQQLQRDDRAAMDIERVEARTEVAIDIGQARLVEEGEHLVIFPPQLTQPLNRERLRRHDQTALDASGVDEAIENQGRFDRLSKADFIGEQ